MAYLAIKKAKGHSYACIQESYREGGKVRTRIVEYLGAIDPSVAAQFQQTRGKLGLTETKAILADLQAVQKAASASPQTALREVDQPNPVNKPDRSEEAPKSPSPTILKRGDSFLEVDPNTGEVLYNKGRVFTTEKQETLRPFAKSLKLPKGLAEHQLSETAFLRTHQRYGQRLKDLEINPAFMPDITIRYGHPDRMVKKRDGSFVIYASRRTKNKRHTIAKAKLWKHYREALSAGYLEAIRKDRPQIYNDLEVELCHHHQEAKSSLLKAISITKNPVDRLRFSLQLILWNRLGKSYIGKHDPSQFGQHSFETVGNWKFETIAILSEVQKNGWSGVIEKNTRAMKRHRANITRKANQIKGLTMLDKLSGKRRKLVREILKHEAELGACTAYQRRIERIRANLPFA